MCRMARMTPAESTNAMSSGMRVRNIQNAADGGWSSGT